MKLCNYCYKGSQARWSACLREYTYVDSELTPTIDATRACSNFVPGIKEIITDNDIYYCVAINSRDALAPIYWKLRKMCIDTVEIYASLMQVGGAGISTKFILKRAKEVDNVFTG